MKLGFAMLLLCACTASNPYYHVYLDQGAPDLAQLDPGAPDLAQLDQLDQGAPDLAQLDQRPPLDLVPAPPDMACGGDLAMPAECQVACASGSCHIRADSQCKYICDP